MVCIKLPLMVISIAVAITLAGCGKRTVATRFQSGVSTQQRAMAAQLPVFREALPEGSFQVVKPVTGLSCQITALDDYQASADNALEKLRLATLQAGANAVMEVECAEVDWKQSSLNCFQSYECRGIAVRRLGTQ